jgi:hypothetical protein
LTSWQGFSSRPLRSFQVCSVEAGRFCGVVQLPAVAESCRPSTKSPETLASQYTTRARERRLPTKERRFNRSFNGQGLLVTTRAPCRLTFSVTPCWAGKRTSRLARSTATRSGVRFSKRFGSLGIALCCVERDSQTSAGRGGGRGPIIRPERQ